MANLSITKNYYIYSSRLYGNNNFILFQDDQPASESPVEDVPAHALFLRSTIPGLVSNESNIILFKTFAIFMN